MAARPGVKELIEVIRPYPVEYLYKYRSMGSAGLVELFSERKIYLNNATKFNDPFECRPALTYHQSALKRQLLLKEMTRHHFPDANRQAVRKLMKGKDHLLTNPTVLEASYQGFVNTVGIYCLSERNDDILMWSHYADSHQGLCLQFDASTEKTIFWEAFKVVYQEEYPVVNIMDMGKAEEFRKALLTKSDHWNYEQERRILKMELEGGPGHYSFAPELLKGVILGALMTDEDRNTLLNWIKKYPAKISVYQAALNGSRYQLNITETIQA